MTKSLELLSRTDLDDPRALYKIGQRFFYGKAVEVDMDKAVHYYGLAAKKGCSDAQFALGVCYEKGLGVKTDLVEANKYYHLAVDQRHSAAISKLQEYKSDNDEQKVDKFVYGLKRQFISSEKGSLYQAIAVHVNQDQGFLRKIVKAHIIRNIDDYLGFFDVPEGQAIAEYIDRVVGSNILPDYIEIKIMSKLLDRTIVLIVRDGKMFYSDYAESYIGSPIFVFYDPVYEYYDPLLLEKNVSAEGILNKLLKDDAKLSPDILDDRNVENVFSGVQVNRAFFEKAGDESDDDVLTSVESNMFPSTNGFQHAYVDDEQSIEKKQNNLIHDAVVEGLELQPISADGHCFYHAIALYLGEDQSFIRQIVSAHLAANIQKYEDFSPLPEDKTIQDYIEDLRSENQWAGELELNILVRLFERPIIVICADGNIQNLELLAKYPADPIFVFYNGVDHYDAIILKEGYRIDQVLNNLLEKAKDQDVQSPNIQLNQPITSVKMAHATNEAVHRMQELALSYQIAADNNDDPVAQNHLGDCYRLGRGVNRNISLAIQYYQFAVEQNNGDAQYNLGYCYENGLGVELSLAKAIGYYEDASSTPEFNKKAAARLQGLYKNSISIARNFKERFSYFSQQSRLHNVVAIYELACLYENGLGTARDARKATELYRLAKNKGYKSDKKDDIHNLFSCLLESVRQKNEIEILEYLQENKIDLEQMDVYGWRLIHFAVQVGSVDLMNAILLWGSNPEVVTKDGWKPIHIAAIYGQLQCLEGLLTSQNVNMLTLLDETPLYVSAQAGRLNIVKLLCEKGAQIDLKAYQKTALDMAKDNHHDEIVEFLQLFNSKKRVCFQDGLSRPFRELGMFEHPKKRILLDNQERQMNEEIADTDVSSG